MLWCPQPDGGDKRRRGVAKPAMMRVAALLLLLLGAGAAPLVQTGPLTFAPLVRRVVPAVVSIMVQLPAAETAAAQAPMPPELRGTPFEKSYRDRMRGRREPMTGAGSGFIIDPTGLIVTNAHVVGRAQRIMVSLTDGVELPARLLGVDDLTDIALIKVAADHALPAVRWGDSRQVQVGDWILAAGNPFGLGGSVTAGIVSARGREIGAGPFDDFFQLDAPINPGNSGGPAFDMAGEVVALNTALVSPTGASVGIGFAIPSEIVMPVVAELARHGHMDRGWLGVTLDTEDKHPGATVAEVSRGGPAARAGLRAGDLVTGLNGAPIAGSRALIRNISEIPPGSTARLHVHRSGGDVELPVAVGKRPPEPPTEDPAE